MLRPMGIGELLDASFRVFRRRFRTLALCVLVVVAPLTILSTLVQASAVDGAFDFGTGETDIGNGESAIAGLMVSYLLTLFATVLATAACFRAVEGDVVGRDVDWRESLGFAARRSAGLLLVLVLYVVVVVIGLALLVVPGIWLAVAFSLVAPAVLFEGRRSFGAFGRSFGLVRGHWWRTFGAEAIMLVLVTVIQMVLGALAGVLLFAEASNEVLNASVLTLVNILGYVVSLPLQSALFALIYFDLRVRKEGLDLELMGQRIGDASPAPAADPQVWPPPAAAPERPGAGFLPPEPPR